MSEQDQRDRNDGRAERMDDLEVRGDEARDVAGGKNVQKKGVQAKSNAMGSGIRHGKKES
jgi:uncharacterized circularly permuted ATP-grasp superfamily protein